MRKERYVQDNKLILFNNSCPANKFDQGFQSGVFHIHTTRDMIRRGKSEIAAHMYKNQMA